MMRKYVLFIVVGVVIVSGVAFIAMNIKERTRGQAEKYVNYVRSLKVGRTSFSEFQRQLNKYDKFEAESGCNAQNCVETFSLENTWASLLLANGRANLHTRLVFQNGSLTGVAIGVWCYPWRGGVITTSVSESSPTDDVSRQSYLAGTSDYFPTQYRSTVMPGRINIQLTPEAGVKQHEEAYSFHLDVFDHTGACHDANDILPFARPFPPRRDTK